MATITGTSGRDVIVGTIDADTIHGGDDNDRINGGAGDDTLFGDAGNDTLTGDAGNDTLHGGDGNDGFFGGGGNDTIYGDAGNDTMYGDGGDDHLYGGSGDDVFFGGSGNDTAYLEIGTGSKIVDGGSGIDRVVLELNSSNITDAMRDDLATLDAFLRGGATSASLTLAALGITIRNVEAAVVRIDGVETPIDSLVNTAPTLAETSSLAGFEDAAVVHLVNAHDPDGDALSFGIVSNPSNGSAIINPATGELRYVPNANFSGFDSFEIRVADQSGGVSVQRVNVAIDAVADAPTLSVNDISVAVTGITQSTLILPINVVGTAGGDTLTGGLLDDTLDGAGFSTITTALDITSALTDLDGSEILSVRISGVPSGGTLSAGIQNSDGSWTLTQSDLNDLALTATVNTGFTLAISATSTEQFNGVASTTDGTIDVTLDAEGDVINGGAGSDFIRGGAGDDSLYGGDGDDIIYGGDGNDFISTGAGNDFAYGEAGDDTIIGNSGNNVINAGTGDNVVSAGSGRDKIVAGGGNDVLDGGASTDILDFSAATSGVTIDAANGTYAGFGEGTFINFESYVGSSFDDLLIGGAGRDSLDGGAGNDIIRSGRGSDTLSGGSGDDTFVFTVDDVIDGRRSFGRDAIVDFEAGDSLDLSDFFAGWAMNDITSALSLRERGNDTIVSVDLNGRSYEIVELDGVSDLSIADMLNDGSLVVA